MPFAQQIIERKIMNSTESLPGSHWSPSRNNRAIARKETEPIPLFLLKLRAVRRSAVKFLDATGAAANFTRQSTKRIYGTHQ